MDSKNSSFSVFQYTIEEFIRIVGEGEIHPQFFSGRFNGNNYFKTYFEKLKAKTIVVENSYVDRDFLEDFAAYYVRCFNPYQRYCRRLHFFSRCFDTKDFEDILTNSSDSNSSNSISIEELDTNYLGFIVLKPLPQTRIGRTCLKNTDLDGERKHFPITRIYNVNLFGVSLNVKSLAFQEQDKVISACATSALWSVFHWTGLLFQHSIPSPVLITQSSIKSLALETRSFPNNGLTGAQMSQAIRDVGLDPLLLHIDSDNAFLFKFTLYAYLRGEIPIILGVILEEVEENDNGSYRVIKVIGRHAVTVTGYSLGGETKDYKGFTLLASRMDKIYVHDDQIGPFAPMIFQEDLEIQNVNSSDLHKVSRMSTCWNQRGNKGNKVIATRDILIIPAYHKIRLSYDTIFEIVITFQKWLETVRVRFLQGIIDNTLEWDIYLTTGNNVKTEIRNCNLLETEELLRILTYHLPRFIWYAKATNNGTPVLDLLFDATDIDQGNFIILAIEYIKPVSTFVRQLAKSLNDIDPLLWKVLKWFKE